MAEKREFRIVNQPMKSISVIIPSHNRARLLPRCLDSVLAQTRGPDEIIVVDDGSTDGTAALVAERYPDIKLMAQPNRGVSAARNAGVRAARGDWVAFLDSDDAWLPAKLERQCQAIEKDPEQQALHTNEVWIRNGVRVNQKRKHKKRGGFIFQRCLPLCVISPSSVMLHRRVFAQVGLFDETLPVCEDYDLWLRICARMPVSFIDEPLVVKYGGHEDQLSKKHWGMDRFRIRALDKILDDEALAAPDRQAALAMLVEKAGIYLRGAKKHGNPVFVNECERVLARRALS